MHVMEEFLVAITYLCNFNNKIINIIFKIMLMTKRTSSTRLEFIPDIDKFPTQYFKNRKYVFPNNKLIASFTLSVMYKCLSYEADQSLAAVQLPAGKLSAASGSARLKCRHGSSRAPADPC